ncbi:hypothetical protein U8607_11835 [Methylobacterium durans]|uniref:Uncharacterized protein n=1 Tax=Methylobacterium durans TaxID=2202825 RepID=A0A2U8WF50_9HYPH|nr:hypothetical protein [Methylobacterium durans]AWN44168.1 hypothetical protein DK389_31230 [Methylobacterium durans]MEA1832774.1 hypothetical protein [Methylobacterium durans]
MNDPSPTPLYIGENPVTVPVHRAVEKAYLWALAAIGGTAAAGLVVFAVATQCGSDAERMANADAAGSGYLGTLVTALAVNHGRKPF